jgi:hypothetical protein
MIDKLVAGLGTIDTLLDKTPIGEVAEHVSKLEFGGYGKKNYGEYMAFEVKLLVKENQNEGEKFSEIYVRGFEKNNESAGIANSFLEELTRATQNYFSLPQKWPALTRGDEAHKQINERQIQMVKDGVVLRVTALGGGRYAFKGDSIKTWGASELFGLGQPGGHIVAVHFHLLIDDEMGKEPYRKFKGGLTYGFDGLD